MGLPFQSFRFGNGPGEVDQGPIAERGVDRLYLQGDPEGTVVSAFEQGHPQRYQGAKRSVDG